MMVSCKDMYMQFCYGNRICDGWQSVLVWLFKISEIMGGFAFLGCYQALYFVIMV